PRRCGSCPGLLREQRRGPLRSGPGGTAMDRLLGAARSEDPDAAQISRERKLQMARISIAAIHAAAQAMYAAGGGSAAKKGFAATAGPAACWAAITIEGSRLQTAPRHSPSVGTITVVAVPTCVTVALLRAAPTPPTIPPIPGR